jgi:hypothetical protein
MMHIFILFGDEKRDIVNSNCQIDNLFDHLKVLCNINDPNVDIDLCDLNGDVKRLADNKTLKAIDFIKTNETYILLKIESNIKCIVKTRN